MVTRERTLSDRIVNDRELEAWAEQLQASPRATEATTRDGVIKAVRVCRVLADADHLSENQSVSAPGLAQLRPDLVLTSDSGHYVLVELKTTRVPERQGVQELLAYSAAIKTQMPYVNDFMFVIVARYWDNNLVHATRALIMDGKHVLPLQVAEKSRSADGKRDFSLSIRQELFQFNFVQFFDPWYALVPAQLGVYRPRWSLPVDRYLCHVLRQATYDAVRLNQTGFAFFWVQRDSSRVNPTELACATLVTVNQHWREGEDLPGRYPRIRAPKQAGFHGLHSRIVDSRRRTDLRHTDDMDWWHQVAANHEASRVYKQSALSYELLERYRNREEEASLWHKTPEARDFDLEGGYLHLSMFMQKFADQPMVIKRLSAFGELADFVRERYPRSPCNHSELSAVISHFHAHKMAQPDALPDRLAGEQWAGAGLEHPPELDGNF